MSSNTTDLTGQLHKLLKFFAISITLLVAGCVSRTLEQRAIKSYVLGAERSASIGEAFLVDQQGTVTKVKEWVGILNSKDGWATNHVYSQDFIRRELIYSGISGTTVSISYREFRNNVAAPSFFQTLTYDLQSDRDIKFQNFQIRIVNADNKGIRFVVLEDGSAENAKVATILSQKKGRAGISFDNNGLVVNVEPGGPSDKAGVKFGDRITKVDGKTVGANSALIVDQVAGEPGTKVVLTLLRGGDEIIAEVIRR